MKFSPEVIIPSESHTGQCLLRDFRQSRVSHYQLLRKCEIGLIGQPQWQKALVWSYINVLNRELPNSRKNQVTSQRRAKGTYERKYEKSLMRRKGIEIQLRAILSVAEDTEQLLVVVMRFLPLYIFIWAHSDTVNRWREEAMWNYTVE